MKPLVVFFLVAFRVPWTGWSWARHSKRVHSGHSVSVCSG